LYEVLFISRKAIAKQFRVWVRNIIKEIRKKGKYDLEEKLKLKEIEYQKQIEAKEQELLKYKEKTYEEIEKTGHLYVIKTDGGTKVGKTKDTVTKRVKGLQTGNVNDIEVFLDFETSNADLLEKCVHYILDRYRCNSNREFFDCNVKYISAVVKICGNVIDTLKSSYQHITESDLLNKFKENGLEFELENTPQLNSNSLEVWLENNVEYKEGSLLQLKDICQLYLNKFNVHSSVSCKYRKAIEQWIKERYKHVKCEYGTVKINDRTFNGWKHLYLKECECGLKLN
jgi:hypothetical protein